MRGQRNTSIEPRLAALSLSVVLAASPVASQAGLKEAMNEMFISATTSTQAIDTQRLRGIYGGSMTLRPAGKGINVVQLAAPRIDAGCGGIDIFFGSFSFVNGEQFEQLLRSLASAAVGFAIKSAIQAMCNPCAAILSELEAAIRELNALAKNTCAVANAMFTDGGMDKLSERASNIGKHLSTAAQQTADWAAGENNRSAEKPRETAKGPGTDQNPMVGNLVYKAAMQSLGNTGGNSLSAFVTQAEAVEMVMGLFGTTVVLPDAENTTSTAQTCGNGVPDARCDIPGKEYGPVIATWDELLQPRKYTKNGVVVYKCGGQNCSAPITGSLSLAAWGGVEDAINLAMFGAADISSITYNDFTSDSIAGSILDGTGGTLSTRAKSLLAIVPAPVYVSLLEVQKSPMAVEMLARKISAYLPDFLAYQMGIEFIKIGNNVFTEQIKANKPDGYDRNLREKVALLSQIRPDPEQYTKIFNDITESVKNIQAFTMKVTTGAQ